MSICYGKAILSFRDLSAVLVPDLVERIEGLSKSWPYASSAGRSLGGGVVGNGAPPVHRPKTDAITAMIAVGLFVAQAGCRPGYSTSATRAAAMSDNWHLCSEAARQALSA